MKFKKSYLKLTAFYALIITVISIIFSMVVYRISSQEIDRGFTRQARFMREFGFNMPNPQVEQLRQQQIKEANQKIVIGLIDFNLLILVLATLVSYLLARQTIKPIEDAMEAQNQFTADASHELRTPLTAMRTEIEVAMRDKKLDEKDARILLKSNLEEIAKLEDLTNSLLKLARNEQKTEGFEFFDLSLLVNEVLLRLNKIAQKKSIRLINKINALKIKASRDNINDLLVILVENAIKYSPDKTRVIVDAEIKNNDITIKVKDFGIGISEAQIPHIFDRFYRADSSRSKEKIAGYGLGLSIAKKIVEKYHGEILVQSKVGEGSEFSIKFPL